MEELLKATLLHGCFSRFFIKLYKWYQIAQSIANSCKKILDLFLGICLNGNEGVEGLPQSHQTGFPLKDHLQILHLTLSTFKRINNPLFPLNYQKTYGFLMISGVIEVN